MKLAVVLVLLSCATLASIPKVGTGPRPGIILIQPERKVVPDSVHILRVDSPKKPGMLLARFSAPYLMDPTGRTLCARKSYEAPADTCATWNVSPDGVLFLGYVAPPLPPTWRGHYEFRAFWNGKGHNFPELRR